MALHASHSSSKVFLFRALSKYSGRCYHLYLLCPLLGVLSKHAGCCYHLYLLCPLLGALSKRAGCCYHLYLLCPLLQGSLKVCRPLLPFVSLMSSSSGLSQGMQAIITICISYVLFFTALSKYPDRCYHLYLSCPLLQGSLRVSRLLLPFVSLMSPSSGLSQSIQTAVTVCISHIPFFRALSKYPDRCYHLYLSCPLLWGSLKVSRKLLLFISPMSSSSGLSQSMQAALGQRQLLPMVSKYPRQQDEQEEGTEPLSTARSQHHLPSKLARPWASMGMFFNSSMCFCVEITNPKLCSVCNNQKRSRI